VRARRLARPLANLILDPSLHVLLLAVLLRPLCRCLAAILGR
jgi:hypothetical protein